MDCVCDYMEMFLSYQIHTAWVYKLHARNGRSSSTLHGAILYEYWRPIQGYSIATFTNQSPNRHES